MVCASPSTVAVAVGAWVAGVERSEKRRSSTGNDSTSVEFFSAAPSATV